MLVKRLGSGLCRLVGDLDLAQSPVLVITDPAPSRRWNLPTFLMLAR